MSQNWYNMSVSQTESKLHTSASEGLSRKVVRSRLNRLGKNRIFPIPNGSFSSYLKQVLSDFTSVLLAITAVLAILFNQKVSAGIILVLLAIHYGAAILVYVRAQRVLEDMGNHALPNVKVMRDGRLYIVKQEMLVPGDLIFLSVGDIVPADCRLVQGENLTVLEGKITGEGHSVYKDADFVAYGEVPVAHQQNMLFASTIVTGGAGRALVCEAGENTMVCRLHKNAPLISHEKLRVIALFRKYCAVWSLCMITLVFALTVTDLFIGFSDRGLFNIFLTGLSLACASMSELYAAFGYIVIATGIFSAMQQKKEINEGALIKNSAKLDQIKDLNCLIFPREATFVARNCTIERACYGGRIHAVSDKTFPNRCGQLLRYAVLSSGIYGARALITNNDRSENIYTPEEEAILTLASRIGVYNISLEREYPMIEHIGAGVRSRFDTTLVGYNGGQIVVVRGEALAVIKQCRYCNENGRSMPLAGDRLNQILAMVSRLSKETLRVVAVATRSTSNVNLSRINAAQSDLTFEGLIAFREPLLPNAALNLSKCRTAGIRTIMLCDSFSETNIRMAESLGIISSREEALDGYAMAAMKEGMFRIKLPSYHLFLGLSPAQKEHLLECLQEQGYRVGVICRQLNEAKLVRMADVSFAQSITISHRSGQNASVPVYVKDDKYGSRTGCEAIKFLSDVVLAEPGKKGHGGINGMLGAIGAAKVIYLNLLRMARYLITSQIAKFLIVLYGIVAHRPILSPVHILITGLLLDFVAVVAIAFERPGRNILQAKVETEQKLRHPFTSNAPYFLLGIIWAALCAVMQILPSEITHLYETVQLSTATFFSFIITQIVLLTEMKKEDSLFRGDISLNSIFAFVIAGCGVFITLCQISTGFASLFGLTSLTVRQMLTVFPVPFLMLIACEITKWIAAHVRIPDPEARKERRAEKKARKKALWAEKKATQKKRSSLWHFPVQDEDEDEDENESEEEASAQTEILSLDDSDQTSPAEEYIDPQAFDQAQKSGMDPELARQTAEIMLSLYGNNGTQETDISSKD